MKALLVTTLLALLISGCNTITGAADKIMDKQSSFSQDSKTIYPTTDGKKDSEPANFGKQAF